MRTNGMGSRILRDVVRTLSLMVLTVVVMGLCATCAVAGEASAQPNPNLDMTNAAGKFLLQPASEASLWSRLHVTGYLSQTFGMWQNPTALQGLTPSRNNLAVARTLLQVDEDFAPDVNDHFFMREWFVYEPPYSFNSAEAKAYQEGSSNTFRATPSWGHFANDFYNQYNVRDAWWEHTAGPLNLYIGNQIVVWGQSLAFRVGDVINPQDITWAFGFSNLEQSRIPQWMIHPILNLPDFGPFTSNFIEGVIIPGVQPMWNSVDYADGRYYGENDIAGRVQNGLASGISSNPPARFQVRGDSQYYPGRNIFPAPGALIPPPFSREFMYCGFLGTIFPAQYNPLPPNVVRNPGQCNLGIVNKALPWGPSGGNALTQTGPWKVPPVTLANMQEGVRLRTIIGETELTALYYNTFEQTPNWFWQEYTNQWSVRFQPIQDVGVTADRPIPVPASLAMALPLIARAEAVYTNHEPFLDYNPLDISGVRYSDTVRWMGAIDLDSGYAPWLTKTGTLNVNFEMYDLITLDSSNSMFETPGAAAQSRTTNFKHDVSMLFNVGTSYWWGAIAPTWTMVFSPNGRTFLLFPSLVLTPPWTNKYFLKLQYIGILGGDNQAFQAGGAFKGQSFITAQFQYNFNLM